MLDPNSRRRHHSLSFRACQTRTLATSCTFPSRASRSPSSSLSFELGPTCSRQKEFACAWVRGLSRCARSCVFTRTPRPRKAGSLTLARGAGASARTGAADRQRAAGAGGSARAAARRVRSVSGQPAKSTRRSAIATGQTRDSPTSSWASARAFEPGARAVRADRRRQRRDRAKRRQHRRGHPDGAAAGGVGLLPRGPRE